MAVNFDAVILAGGRGSRLGGLSKPELVVAGRRLVDASLAAAAGAGFTVVVGDISVPDGVLQTIEEPPFGGPVAGLEAGCALLEAAAGADRAPWTLVLAADLPLADAAVDVLLTADLGDHDGACLVDADGRPQWLLGCYRTPALTNLLTARGSIDAIRRLLEPLDLLLVAGAGDIVVDLDTPEELAAWRSRS